MDNFLRCISDIHGERRVYLTFIKDAPYSLQLGDLDFSYDWLLTEEVDSSRHKFLPGNHDNYDAIPQSPHALKDFGVWSTPLGDIFFVRGAWSIDWRARTKFDVYKNGKLVHAKDLWDEEELSMPQCYEALELYKTLRPKLLITHDCPRRIVAHISDPSMAKGWGYGENVVLTRTGALLEAMLEFHRPKVHIFGHHHRSFDRYIDGATGIALSPGEKPNETHTRYICLPACRYLDLTPKFFEELEK